MSTPQLELRILKPIPAKYRKKQVYDNDPPDLERAYGDAMALSDPWHARLNIKSRYCTMNDLRAYLEPLHPEADFSSWSMTGGLQNQDVYAHAINDVTIHVPWAEYESLMTDHITPIVFEWQVQSWNLDLTAGDRTWLDTMLPRYIDPHIIPDMARMRYEYARKSSAQDRADRISHAGWSGSQAPDIIGAICDGLAEARSQRCALYACIVD